MDVSEDLHGNIHGLVIPENNVVAVKVFRVEFIKIEVEESNLQNFSFSFHADIHVKIAEGITKQKDIGTVGNRVKVWFLLINNSSVLVESVNERLSEAGDDTLKC